MNPGEAREGDFVYTKHTFVGENVHRIVRICINTVVYPGTTNEYYLASYSNLEGATNLQRKPIDCEKSSEAARSKLILEICEQMDGLRLQLSALGLHDNDVSFWKGHK